MAAMAPERSRTLHNFSLPPRLSWGTQKLLRCSKPPPPRDTVSDHHHHHHHHQKRRSESFRNAPFRSPSPSKRTISNNNDNDDGNNQIDMIREKLMLDLRSEVDQMRAAFLGNPQTTPPPAPAGSPEAESRPWNLRTRRERRSSSSVVRADLITPAKPQPPTALTLATATATAEGESKRVKFSVSLTRQEIEDDFVEMMGGRPLRKPKKRPRYVQKHLDTLFPGLWLSEITADMYKVNENPEAAK